MKTHQTAFWLLTASAIILAAVLIPRVMDRMTSPAHAQMVVTKDNMTVLTARATVDSEVVCVLNSTDEVLIGYITDLSGKTIRPVATLDVGAEFQARMRAGGGRGPNRAPR